MKTKLVPVLALLSYIIGVYGWEWSQKLGISTFFTSLLPVTILIAVWLIIKD